MSIALAASGCVVPVSPLPKLKLEGRDRPLGVTEIVGSRGKGGLIRPGMSREEVHRLLGGLSWNGRPSGDKTIEWFHGPDVERTYLYLLAWHGPHTCGLYPHRRPISIAVMFGPDGIVESSEYDAP